MKRVALVLVKSVMLGLMAMIIVGVGKGTAHASMVNFAGPPVANPAVNSLGAFTLSGAPVDHSGMSTPQINLTSTALVTGQVVQTAGSLFVDFDNNSQTLSFANADSLLFRVADQSIKPFDRMLLTDTHGCPVPEPTTLLLLGTGLTGIAAKLRRRRLVRNERQA